MIKLPNKVIYSIIGIALAGGVITATAATVQPKSMIANDAPVSSAVPSEVVSFSLPVSSSTVVSSQMEVSNVADAVSEINEAAKEGVSAVNKAAQDGVQTVKDQQQQQKDDGAKALASVKYAVIDPSTGMPVWPDNQNYEKFKSKLGGDAGTCDPSQSKACQAALAALKAKKEATTTQAPEN